MGQKRRKFSRAVATLAYKKLFIIVAEGKKTEKEYFSLPVIKSPRVQIKCIKRDSKSSPFYVLKRMDQYIRENGLSGTDEAWLVVDTDQWEKEDLKKLVEWAKKGVNRDLAVSNPKFEYWLLLHFEDGTGVSSPANCSERLLKYISDYDKGLPTNLITEEHGKNAMTRAKNRDNPPCLDWPKTEGSTVYRLVANILKEK